MQRWGWTLAGIATVVLAALTTLSPPALAKDDARTAKNRMKLATMRREVLIEAGTRHAKVGTWCRDAGLVAQAAAEFIKAVEVSEGQNKWAERILQLMRNLDDRFWKKKLKKPSAGMIRAYEKRAKKARETYQKERLKLAKWADKKGLEAEALAEYKGVVRLSDDYVKIDKNGLVVLDVGKIPEKYSQRLLADAVTINGKPRIRDAFLEKVPAVKEVHEAANDVMLMRSQISLAQAEEYLRMCTALLPHLEKDMGAKPTRRLRMFIFAKRADYEAYCEAAGHGDHKLAAGLADSGTFVTLVSAEGHDEETVQGIALHELTHLFQYGVTPTVMPSWYNEGFAETYGGSGTFTWDGKKLQVARPMSAGAVQSLRDDKVYIPLKDLLAGDALKRINAADGTARSFYNESWAFFTYLRKHAGEDIQKRFAYYELVCRGAALGAKAGVHVHDNRDASDAAAFFQRLFGKDLTTIESGFRTWLAGYDGT
ncbi:MAG: hypothetical protein QNJ90_06335 [Planctomycetota bacterium]|nr:hypothetical protein [Planctomycetota bacterium]